MKLLLAALAMSAPLLAQTCTYTVSPAAATLPVSATSGSFAVTTSNGCRWAVTANNSTWLAVTDPTQFLGSAPMVSFLAAANNTAQQRSAAITILDANTPTGTAVATFTATQPGAQCSYALNPASAAFGVAGGPGSFQVTTGCVWQPTGASSFLTLASTSPQPGTGTLNYTVAPNTCVFGRSGSIAIGTTSSGLAPVFTLTQDGSSANMTFSPASANAGGVASDGRFTVTTGAGCAWSASSDVTWMQITGGATGAGNGAVSYHLVANTLAPRTGSIHIGNLAFTVTQAPTGPPAPAIAAIESAANYRGDAVSPGEIVAIFGTNMGPSQPVPLQLIGGYVSNFLAGTQVLFDGAPAPLLFTAGAQVNAVVPYGVAGKSSTQVQVVYNGLTSPAVSMAVQAAHPAIFTLDTSGLGPGAILNQDFSVNSSSNGAARGSTVAIYATGGGTTSPALADGAVTGTNLPYLTQAVHVTIGGVDAVVTYSGGAPGSVAGLTQINATVPDGVAPGIAVPVVIRVGNWTSSAGVTLSVR